MLRQIENWLASRWERTLYLFIAFLYLIPLWSVRTIPTQDGPSHLYNARILKEYGHSERYPLLQTYYDLNLKPLPNWFSHAVLMAFMFAVPPLIAEKMLFSAYVLLFLLAGWYFAASVDREKGWYAFLLFPFVYNYLLQMGFTNFCYAVGFYFLAVGYWWRHRNALRSEHAVTLNGILLLAYFSHLVPTVLALVSIGILWLVTLRRRHLKRHLLQIPMLLPSLALPLWFVWDHGTQSVPGSWTTEALKTYLVRLEVLFSFSETQLKLAFVLMVCFWGFHAMTFFREKLRLTERGPRFRLERSDGFLLLSLLFLILYFRVPDGISGGGFMKHRLSLFPFLTLLPWFSARLGKYVKWGGIGVLTLLALFNLGYLIHWYGMLDDDMAEFRSGIAQVTAQDRVLPLAFDRNGRCARIGMFLHAIGYYEAEVVGLEWDNYEATTDYFPVRYKPGLDRPDTGVIEGRPQDVPIELYVDAVDVIHTWAMPPDAPIAHKIAEYYTLVFERGRTRIYRRASQQP